MGLSGLMEIARPVAGEGAKDGVAQFGVGARTMLVVALVLAALSPNYGRASPEPDRVPAGTQPNRQHARKGDPVEVTRKKYFDTEGKAFPAPLLDARAGVPAARSGFWRLALPGEQVELLPKGAFAAVRARALAGERDMLAGNYRAAYENLLAALELLPEPQQRWNAAGWILVTLGENSVRAGSLHAAEAPLQDSVACPGVLGNPWVHFRLGQVRYELDQPERAADELARAYMGGGREVFSGQDPKYFALVEKVLLPPPGMSRLP